MSQGDVDTEPDSSTFLESIDFLTGKNPNGGAFLLVVGIVTAVFNAGFQLLLPTPISHILSALVLSVAVISLIFGAILDTLGHFDSQQ